MSRFVEPDACPACAGPLEEVGDFLYCRSKSCPARLSSAIKVWVARLGLLHWGEAIIDALTDPSSPKVQSVADLYRLSVEDLASCCSGMKVAAKCHQTLHAAKSLTMELLLASLNIPGLGTATASDIVGSGLDSVPKILAASYEDFLAVPNIGDVTARQILEGVHDRRAVIADLVTVLDIRAKASGPLSGQSFCITGATSKPRRSLQKDILDAGGNVKESVAAGLTFLVTNEGGDFNSGKMKKARQLNVRVISEADLVSMIRGADAS